MHNGIKLIACDMDGTLLNAHGVVSPGNAQALCDAAKTGIELCVASGRTLPEIREKLKDIDAPFYYLALNGGYISVKGRDDIAHPLSREQIELCIDEAERYGLGWLVSTLDGVFVCEWQADMWEYARSRINRESVLAMSGRVLKILCSDRKGNPDGLARAKQSAVDAGLAVSSSWTDNFEVNAPGINKGKALRELAHTLGIARENVMALGDYENDLQMLEWAGWSVAMGNALPSVAAVAKYRTAHHDDDGVAKAIRRWALT